MSSAKVKAFACSHNQVGSPSASEHLSVGVTRTD
jgi:hypothetical protein